MKRWPKLLRDLWSTRETGLVDEWPTYVVATWIGNSQPVAAKHYLHVADEHFERAAEAIEAVQNPVQHAAATSCTGSQADRVPAEIPGDCGLI